MKGIIIYKGKYGATAQYARWLSEELNLPVFSSENSDQENLLAYDLLVIGTSVYIGKLQIASWLKDHLPLIRNKKIFLFLGSATPPDENEKLQDYIKSGIPDQIRPNCQVFYLRGKMIVKDLSLKDRLLLKMGAWMVKDPQERKKMLTDFNSVQKENITGIVTAVKKYAGAGQPSLAL